MTQGVATVLYEFQGNQSKQQLAIAKGDNVVVVEKLQSGWCYGYVEGNKDELGYFPHSYLRFVEEDEEEKGPESEEKEQVLGNKKKTPNAKDAHAEKRVQVVRSFNGDPKTHGLVALEGEILTVLDESHKDWIFCKNDEAQKGYIPRSYTSVLLATQVVKKNTSAKVDSKLAKMAKTQKKNPKKKSQKTIARKTCSVKSCQQHILPGTDSDMCQTCINYVDYKSKLLSDPCSSKSIDARTIYEQNNSTTSRQVKLNMYHVLMSRYACANP